MTVRSGGLSPVADSGTCSSLVVPADLPLALLHDVLQIAFGWTDSHLHDFKVGDVRFGMIAVEEELLAVDDRAAPLGAVACTGSSFLYRYDFGDDWEHVIKVEEVVDPDRDPLRLVCVGGARRCPPEDCGGPHGYANVLRVLRNPKDEEHADMKRWVGKGFDPEAFDIEKVNKKLGVIGRRFEKSMVAGRRWRA